MRLMNSGSKQNILCNDGINEEKKHSVRYTNIAIKGYQNQY